MVRIYKSGWARCVGMAAILLAGAGQAFAADIPDAMSTLRVTLSNGFDILCDHRATFGDRVRLYTQPGSESFVEVPEVEIVSVEAAPAPAVATASVPLVAALNAVIKQPLLKAAVLLPDPTPEELRGMVSRAGAEHNLDVDLLASVIRAESGGNIRAVSRTGARGLMQLMPGTATQLGVTDSFHPEQNIKGGTAYLDGLLVRYHDDIALALAAYNAGPAAVDRYHGIPPYRETRAYVARVIHEFNRRKSLPRKEAGVAVTPGHALNVTASAAVKLLP